MLVKVTWGVRFNSGIRVGEQRENIALVAKSNLDNPQTPGGRKKKLEISENKAARPGSPVSI